MKCSLNVAEITSRNALDRLIEDNGIYRDTNKILADHSRVIAYYGDWPAVVPEAGDELIVEGKQYVVVHRRIVPFKDVVSILLHVYNFRDSDEAEIVQLIDLP